MEPILWVIRSPAKILGLLCLSLALALAFTFQEARRLQALLAAKPKIEYVERIKINERVVEVRTPDGSVRVEIVRESFTDRESKEEPILILPARRRFVGVGYGLHEYKEGFVGFEIGQLQLATGVYAVFDKLGAKVQVAWKF